ncbi:MAG: hypothetical protein AMXMBFR74_32270 [Parvibaculum sp.]
MRLAAHGAMGGGGRVHMRRICEDLTDGPAILGIAHANDHLTPVSWPGFLSVSALSGGRVKTCQPCEWFAIAL